MKKLLILPVLMFLTACDPTFDGLLSVKYPFAVKGKTSVVVPAGDFSAKLEAGSKQIDITLKVEGKKQKVTLDLPKKLNVPDNGAFTIPAADLGQEFSAAGTNQQTVTQSDLKTGYQQCTYQRPETVCYPVNNTVVCRQEYRTVYGQQYIEYYDRTTTQALNVNFVHANGAVLANFSGQRSSSERLYRYQDRCF